MYSLEQQQLFETNELDKQTFTPSETSFEQISLFQKKPEAYRASKARTLLNPLCCCTGKCNLRINCMVNAVIIFTVAFWLLIGGFNRQPKYYDCTSKNMTALEGRMSETTFKKLCPKYQPWRVAVITLIGFGTVVWIAAASLLFWGAYKRIAWAVLPPVILIPVGLLNLGVYIVVMLSIFGNYPRFFAVKDFLRTKENPGEDSGCCVPAALLFYTPFASYLIWMAICSFELRKQIKAGVDLNPARSDNKVDMNHKDEDTGTDQAPVTPPNVDAGHAMSSVSSYHDPTS